MWALLVSPIGRLIGVGAIAALLAGFGSYEITAAFKDRTIDQMKLANAQSINDAWKIGWLRRDVQDQAIAKANASNESDQHKITENIQEVVRYVPKYITVHDDAACVLPDGFSRLLDSALTGIAPDQLPDDAGKSIGTSAGPSLSQATAVLAQTLGDYASVRARLLNARDAWAAQAAVAQPPAPGKKPGWVKRNFGDL